MADTRLTDFAVVGRTFIRDDETGRFIETINSGAAKATNELAETLVGLVRGSITAMFKQRSGDLYDKVFVHRVGAQSAEVEATSGHAAPLDVGSTDHMIPNAFGSGVAVLWKGKGRSKTGYHFMRRAEEALNALAPEIVRRNLP